MRLPSDSTTGRFARACLILSGTTALAARGALGGGSPASVAMGPTMQVNGPQADYPLVIGSPYLVGDKTYTPADVLNYDEVGYLTVGSGTGITGAHHTLPYPSYVEVTSLDSGRTILVRLEARGPMDSDHLIALSPDAMTQLEASRDTPVRVRRVNPPEEQRAMLRAGGVAPLRMDTPSGLVEVLRRRLPTEGSASLRADNAAPAELPTVPETETVMEGEAMAEAAIEVAAPAELPAVANAAPVPTATAEETLEAPFETDSFDEAFAYVERASQSQETIAAPQETRPEPRPVIEGGFVVQAAALSNMERARNLADALGGHVEQAGSLYRVRTRPFATRAQAEASLANVRAAGYTDARIYTAG